MTVFFEFDKLVHILWIKIRFKPGSEFVLPNCDIILFKSLNHLLVSFSIFLSLYLNHLMLLHFGPSVLSFVFIKHAPSRSGIPGWSIPDNGWTIRYGVRQAQFIKCPPRSTAFGLLRWIKNFWMKVLSQI